MADTKVENEANELFDFVGDEYSYIVFDPNGTPTPSKVAARTQWLAAAHYWRRSRDYGVTWCAGWANSGLSSIGQAWTTFGTAAGSNAYATTNERTRRKRAAFTTGTSAGSSAGVRLGQASVMRGSSTGRGGFHVLHRFAINTMPATWRAFFGIAPNAQLANADPSTNANIIGIGKDSGDAAWQIMFNAGSGTATKVALSATDFPINDTTAVFEIELYCPPGNSPNVSYWVRKISGVDANGNDTYSKVLPGTITTNLPLVDTSITPQAWLNNDVNAAAAIVDLMHHYYEAIGT